MALHRDNSEHYIRKKLRWYDDCDLTEDASDDTIVNIVDNRTGRMLVSHNKQFVSCTLCPKCFLHLADLQEHHNRFHVPTGNNSDESGDPFPPRRRPTEPRRLKPLLRTSKDTSVESEDSEFERWQRANQPVVTQRSEPQKKPAIRLKPLLRTSKDSSVESEDSELERWQRANKSVATQRSEPKKKPDNRGQIRKSFDNLVGCVPSTPSPRPVFTTGPHAARPPLPKQPSQAPNLNNNKFYRCNVCLELFQTSSSLKLHKTLTDHHDFDCLLSSRDRHCYNAKAIPQSNTGRTIQSKLESFLAQKKLAKRFHISVRVVSSSKKSFQVSHFVQNLFQLPSQRIECDAKTIFLFERFGNVDVIVFALFVQEFDDDAPTGNRRRAFVPNFGAPGFLQGINDELHSELFCQFLLAYLSHARTIGYEQVYFSSRMMADYSGDTQSSVIFNCQNAIRFRTEWLLSVFSDARNNQLAYIGKFRTLADYRHYCRDTSLDERRFPLFIFDDDRDTEEWSTRIERSAVELLRKHRREWIDLDQSASRDIASRSMADVLIYDLLGGHQFVVVNLHLLGDDDDAGDHRSSLDVDDSDDFFYVRRPRFLASPRRFLKKCQKKNWSFDTLQQASHSTAMIVDRIASYVMPPSKY